MPDEFKYVQGKTSYTLSGNGVSLSDVTMTVDNFTLPDGTPITMSMFGDIGYGTFEPGTAKEENFSFTGVVQNGGTATLTGITRGLKFVDPYDSDNSLRQGHAGGTAFVLSNSVQFYNKLSGRDNDENITGIWTFTNPAYPRIDTATPPPTDDEQFAPKKYVDDIAISGSPAATTTVPGIAKLSTAAVNPADPIAVGDNDPRVSPVSLSTVTSGQVEALAGTSGTPSNTNRYVTDADTTSTPAADAVVRGNVSAKVLGGWLGDGSTNIGAALVSNGPGNASTYRNKIINLSTSSVTVTNTTTETAIATATLVGGSLGENDAIIYTLNVSNLDSRTRTLTLRFKIGSTTISTVTLTGSGDTQVVYTGQIEGFIFANNSTSSQVGRLRVWASENVLGKFASSQSIVGSSVGTATENTATNKTITITAQWSAASTGSSITVNQATLMFL